VITRLRWAWWHAKGEACWWLATAWWSLRMLRRQKELITLARPSERQFFWPGMVITWGGPSMRVVRVTRAGVLVCAQETP
jgi:hypothetical protein